MIKLNVLDRRAKAKRAELSSSKTKDEKIKALWENLEINEQINSELKRLSREEAT